ncbi:MAG: O-antigen ligase family protein [Lachnospiraceae bacterium]|nr:O-antigen ligase family protein [Lachnospiraceae bacterium]
MSKGGSRKWTIGGTEKLPVLAAAAAFSSVVVLSGGFYEYAAMTSGLIAVIAAFLFLRSRERCLCATHYDSAGSGGGKTGVIRRLNVKLLIPVLFLLYTWMVTVWSVDAPMNLVGSMRLAPCLVWLYLCFLLTDREKAEILSFVPFLGTAVTLTAGLSFFFEPAKALFWRADRLGGTFQYANTCALFLLLGLVILYRDWEKGGKGAANRRRSAVLFRFVFPAGVLLAGLLMTGSRSMLLLFLLWIPVTGFRRGKREGMLAVAAVMGAFLLILLFVGLGGSTQNIGRITTFFTADSTILGRLLYWKDAVRLLVRRPFGLGASGYYYLQPVFQHGVYTTRYVHNDYLQTALDYGIVPALALAGYLICQILRGRQSALQKELLVLMLVSAFADFHFQYLSLLFLLILCLDPGSGDQDRARLKRATKSQLWEIRIELAGAFLVFGCLLIPFTALRLHDCERCLYWLPHETQAELELLNTAETQERAQVLAEALLSHNVYIGAAYKNLGYVAFLKGDGRTAMEEMDRMIAIRRYDVREYRAYDEMLLQIADQAVLSGDQDLQREALERRESLRTQLAQLEETTDPLAFRLRDVPVFTWE